MEEKQGKELKLPIRTGEKVRFVNLNGDTCETVVRYIDSVIYSDRVLYVSFFTKNSFYKNLPVKVAKRNTFYDGQVIKPGEVVRLENGEYETVKGIYEINSGGIIIVNSKNEKMIGDVISA